MGAEVFEGSIYIEAPPEEVFVHFTEADALCAWMGDHAELEPRPGGRFVLHLGDRIVEGRYVVVDFPSRLVVTWGRHGSVRLPPGGSTLEVTLVRERQGTRVTVIHDGLPAPERILHARGWSHYLQRLGAVSEGRWIERHHVPAHLTEGAD